MTRLHVSQKAQLEAFKANALCPKCFKPFSGDVQFDHEIPLGLDGPDHDEKPMVPLHAGCHKIKTSKDQADIARAKRRKRYHETGKSSAKKHVKKIQNRNTLGGEEYARIKAWKQERRDER